MKTPSDDVLKLLEEIRPEMQQEGDITPSMAAEVWGIGKRTTSLKYLRETLIPMGWVELKGVLLDNGAHGSVFRKVEE